MKKKNNGLRKEYALRRIKGGVKVKHSAQYRSGMNLVLLDPDVAKVFENERSVNWALRSLIKLGKTWMAPSR